MASAEGFVNFEEDYEKNIGQSLYKMMGARLKIVKCMLEILSNIVARGHYDNQTVMRAKRKIDECFYELHCYTIDHSMVGHYSMASIEVCCEDLKAISKLLLSIHYLGVPMRTRYIPDRSRLHSKILAIICRLHVAYQHLALGSMHEKWVRDYPLHEAVYEGDLLTVRACLNREDDPNARNGCGGTALHAAVFGGDAEVFHEILAAGAEVDARDTADHSPLMLAALVDDEALVSILLEKGANPTLEDEFKQTPLHVAVSRDNLEMVKALVEHGASVSARDSFGNNPSSLARPNLSDGVHNYLTRVLLVQRVKRSSQDLPNKLQCLKDAVEV